MVKKSLILILFTIFIFALPPKPPSQKLPWENDVCLTPGMNFNNNASSDRSNWATHTPNNRVYGVWFLPSLPGRPVIMRWWDQIGSWSPAETVNAGTGSGFSAGYYPSVAGDSNNNVHFIWIGESSFSGGAAYRLIYRAKKTTGWTNILRLLYGWHPKIAGGKSDTAHIIYANAMSSPILRIEYVKVYADTNPQIVDIDTISPLAWPDNRYPHIAVDGQNRVHVVWQSNIPIGPSYPMNIFYCMRDTNGVWGAVETISASLFPYNYNNFLSRVAVDSNGNVHVVWNIYTTNDGRYHIAHRMKTSSGWSQTTIFPPTSTTYNWYYPTCAVDPNNNLHIAFQTDAWGSFYNIGRLIRRPDGTWEGPDTVTNFTDGYYRTKPEIVATRDGRIHLFRTDSASYTNNYSWIYYKRFIFYHDIGVKEILQPVGNVPKAPLEPKMIVKNYGIYTASFPAYFQIYDENNNLVYCDTAQVNNLAPEETLTIVFTPWTPATTGYFTLKGITDYNLDQNRSNDTLEATLFVYYKDVGISEIIQPVGNYPVGTTIEPKCKVKNYGNLDEFNINVRCSVPDINYYDVVTIDLAPYEEVEVTFSELTVTPGSHTIYFYTTTDNDMNPDNDLASATYWSGHLDVGATQIISPTGTILRDPNVPKPVSGKVKNFGDYPWTFWTFFKIYKGNDLVYIDSLYVMVDPEVETTLTFTSYLCADTGNYTTILKTALVGDVNPDNDSLVGSFQAILSIPGTPGWHKMPDVAGATKRVKSGGALVALRDTIYAVIGNNTRDLMVYDINTNTWSKKGEVPYSYLTQKKKNVKKGASICTDGQYIYVIKGNNTQEFWRFNPENDSWKEYQINFSKGIKGSSMTFDGESYIYIICGSNNNEWKRFNITTETFEPCEPPTLPANKWKTGSWIVYLPTDPPAIYALRVDGATNEFYRIPIGGTPTSKAEMPLIGSSGSPKKAREGSAGAFNPDNQLIYALKGNNTLEFFSYNPATDQWTILEDVGQPEGTPTKKVKGGGALTYSPATGRLFAFIGNNTKEFWSYTPATLLLTQTKPADNINIQAETNKLKNFLLTVNQIKDYLKISYTLPVNAKATLKIYNALGEVLYHATSDKNYFIVDTKKFATGIYIMKFEANEYKATKKLIIH